MDLTYFTLRTDRGQLVPADVHTGTRTVIAFLSVTNYILPHIYIYIYLCIYANRDRGLRCKIGCLALRRSAVKNLILKDC